MTTIITRLYSDAKTANAVRAALLDAGQDASTIDVVTKKDDGAEKKPVLDRIVAADVAAGSAALYAPEVEAGRALVVVRAPFNPFGTALRAIRVVDATPWIHVGVPDQNEYRRVEPGPVAKSEFMTGFPKVLKDHPRFMSSDMNPVANRRRGLVSAAFGLRLLSRERPRTSAVGKAGFMSTRFFPFPLLSQRKPTNALLAGGGEPISKRFGLPLLSKRDWPFASRD